jgi:D-aspartate ligase
MLQPTPARNRVTRSIQRPGSVGAVVIGGDYQGLGIVRSLGRRGVPVCVVDDEYSISRFSRHASHWVTAPDLRDERCTVNTLLDTGRRLNLDGWVLYPTRDETVAAISRHREVLKEVFRVPTPAWSVISFAWDKRNTHSLARKLGIPAPRTWLARSAAELEGLDAEPPFVLKPAIKPRFLQATKDKAWRANSRKELRQLFARASAIVGAQEVMVQELVPGGGERQFAYCALFKDGRALASMVARRWRQHPHEFGRSSTYCETVDRPELEALSERYLKAIDYYGLVELEYKLDARTGEYKLLDFNARTWGYHTLGSKAGVDFPWLLHSDQVGEPPPSPPPRARPGVRWRRLVTDVPAAAVELAARRLGPGAYLRSLGGPSAEAVFSPRDPMPGLAELALVPYLVVKRGY